MRTRWPSLVVRVVTLLSFACGCAAPPSVVPFEPQLAQALLAYRAGQRPPPDSHLTDAWPPVAAAGGQRERGEAPSGGGFDTPGPYLTFCLVPDAPATRPASRDVPRGPAALPPNYWKDDVWRQARSEAIHLVKEDFWLGFRKAFWKPENALLLAGTMGASVAIRETGVDDAVNRRTYRHRQLGDLDETLQIIGNPGTHFAAAGVWWLGSTLLQSPREHEVAKSLVQALCVNGVTVTALKVATNTRTPDDERFGWPSGHTASAFTFAAVVNEYYGPWVGVPALSLAGFAGYQRLDSRVHDFSDVVVGAVLGYVIGSSIARDNKGQQPELFGMKLIPYSDPERGVAGLALYKSF